MAGRSPARSWQARRSKSEVKLSQSYLLAIKSPRESFGQRNHVPADEQFFHEVVVADDVDSVLARIFKDGSNPNSAPDLLRELSHRDHCIAGHVHNAASRSLYGALDHASYIIDVDWC